MKRTVGFLSVVLLVLFAASVAWSLKLYLSYDELFRSVIKASDSDQAQALANAYVELTGVLYLTLGLGFATSIISLINASMKKVVTTLVYREATTRKDLEQKAQAEQAAARRDYSRMESQLTHLDETQDPAQAAEDWLGIICQGFESGQGLVFRREEAQEMVWIAGFAYALPSLDEKPRFPLGEGLIGQVAKEGRLLNITEVPQGYIKVFSGLGETNPRHLAVVPVKDGNTVVGVVEVAGFQPFSPEDCDFLLQSAQRLASSLTRSEYTY